MASRTIGALQRNVESLAHSLLTATRRAEEKTLNDEGEAVPKHPGASAEVERLSALHADALASLEARLDAPAAEGPAHERELNDGAAADG